MAVFAVHAFFKHGAANALNNTAPNLLIDQHGVDDGAAVFNAPVLEQFDKAGFCVDFDIGGLNAVGECKTIFTGCVVPSDGEL